MDIKLRRLQEVEGELDKINGDYGNCDAYCLFCGSTGYNGEVGIVHKKECAIMQLRRLIKSLL